MFYEKNLIFTAFSVRVVAGSFSSERAQKMLKIEVLDAKKFDDTAENEAFEVPKCENCEYITRSLTCARSRAVSGPSSKKRTIDGTARNVRAPPGQADTRKMNVLRMLRRLRKWPALRMLHQKNHAPWFVNRIQRQNLPSRTSLRNCYVLDKEKLNHKTISRFPHLK